MRSRTRREARTPSPSVARPPHPRTLRPAPRRPPAPGRRPATASAPPSAIPTPAGSPAPTASPVGDAERHTDAADPGRDVADRLTVAEPSPSAEPSATATPPQRRRRRPSRRRPRRRRPRPHPESEAVVTAGHLAPGGSEPRVAPGRAGITVQHSTAKRHRRGESRRKAVVPSVARPQPEPEEGAQAVLGERPHVARLARRRRTPVVVPRDALERQADGLQLELRHTGGRVPG